MYFDLDELSRDLLAQSQEFSAVVEHWKETLKWLAEDVDDYIVGHYMEYEKDLDTLDVLENLSILMRAAADKVAALTGDADEFSRLVESLRSKVRDD